MKANAVFANDYIMNKISLKHPKVALVEVTSPLTHAYSKIYFPRVGIPTMGAILKKLGYNCDLWFQSMSDFKEEKLQQYDIVGLGSLSNTIPEAYRLADSLKQKGIIVILGGPHVTFMPEEALEHCNYVVIGEGDNTLPSLVSTIASGGSPHTIPGLAYKLPSGEIHYTEPADLVDYKNLLSPDFLLSPQVRKQGIPPIVVTSRGCPHNCPFCCVTAVFGRQYRIKTNEQVIAELRPVLHRSITFGDDNFFAQPARTKSLLRDMIVQNAVPLRWATQMCVKAASDEEFLDLMKETHCRTVYLGVESVIPETLKKFRKTHNVEAIGHCVEKLHKRNIGIHGMFVVDINDDINTPRKIVDYAIATDMDMIQIFSFTPFPGTAAYKEFQNDLLHRDWGYFDCLHVVAKPRKCSAYDMQMAIMHELKRFYSLKRIIGAYHPGRKWRIKYRLGGHYLVRKWLKENADYIERLRTEFSGNKGNEKQ